MSTVRDIVKGSLRLIGALAAGEAASADEQADAILAMNAMLDSWSAEGLIVNARTREEFSLVASTQTYTMGSSGTWNTTRPSRVERVMLEVQSTPVYELPIKILTPIEWAEKQTKESTSEFPSEVWIQGTAPLERFTFWPIPTAAHKAVIYSEKPLGTYANASTDIDLPAGYERAIRYNLAVELAPEFGKSAPAEVVAIAQESKATIMRLNSQPLFLECDPAITGPGVYDIHSGTYR
jgi:hypothetical protein